MCGRIGNIEQAYFSLSVEGDVPISVMKLTLNVEYWILAHPLNDWHFPTICHEHDERTCSETRSTRIKSFAYSHPVHPSLLPWTHFPHWSIDADFEWTAVMSTTNPENALLPIYPIRSLHLSIWAYDILSPQGAREPPFFFHLKGFVGQSSFPLLAAWRMPQTAMPYNSDPHSSTQKPTLDMPDQVLTVLRDAAHFSPSPHLQRAAVLALGIVDLIPVSWEHCYRVSGND